MITIPKQNGDREDKYDIIIFFNMDSSSQLPVASPDSRFKKKNSLPDEVYAGLDYLTPNESEFKRLTGCPTDEVEELAVHCKPLLEKGTRNIIITLGSRGALHVNREGHTLYRPPEVQAVDTTAAGDTFNAALALTAVDVLRGRGWAISDEAAFAGIASARWPGRFEVVDTAPLTIVDGGHNPQGAEALAASLADLLGEEGRASVDFALGVLADKDYPAMVRAVAPWARSFSVYAPKSPRALAADELEGCVREVLAEEARAGEVPVRTCGAPADALRAARDAAGPEGCVVAFGTLYAIADLMGAL